MFVGSSPAAVTEPSKFASSKGFLDIHAIIKCGFTVKRVRDVIRTYSSWVNFHDVYRGKDFRMLKKKHKKKITLKREKLIN